MLVLVQCLYNQVIVSAGVHSAPILERSGVGNQHIIGKVLKAAKK